MDRHRKAKMEGIMAIEELFPDTVEIVDQTLDKWGEPSGAETVTTERCRIEYENKLVRNFQGEQVVSSAHVFLGKRTVATERSILRFDGRDNPILAFSKLKDSVSLHHIEAFVA